MDGQTSANTQVEMIQQSFVKRGGLADFILKPCPHWALNFVRYCITLLLL